MNMKKIFTLVSVLCTMYSVLLASERIVWEGNKAISWNSEMYAGEQFDTHDAKADMFAGLLANDTIRVSVEAKIDEPQYVMTYKAGSSWEWTDLTDVTVADGLMSYIVSSDEMAQWIAERGLVFRGQGYDMTKIVVATKDEDPEPPQPQDTVPYTFADVWTGDKAISWNTEVYAGEQFDTYTVQQDMFAGLAANDSIKVFYAEAIEGAQFAASYKAGEDWTWTDLAITERDGFYAYRIASEEMAELIADRGIVLRGQGYHATHIAIGKPQDDAQGIEMTNANAKAVKILRAGQVLIIRDNTIYSILGQKIQ